MFKLSDIQKIIKNLEYDYGEVYIEKIKLEKQDGYYDLKIEFQTVKDGETKGVAVYK